MISALLLELEVATRTKMLVDIVDMTKAEML